MDNQYLIRLDDACPTQNSERWLRIERILDRHNVCPMVGIVPDNRDPKLKCSKPDGSFWGRAREWQRKGWTIALHGLHHEYHKCHGGLNPLWSDTEFVGLDYETQLRMLRSGVEILRKEGLGIDYFFAPSHTFDINTVRALKEVGVRYVSDTIALRPYAAHGISFIPQIGGRCRKLYLSGIYTFCFHPNTMSEKDFNDLDRFLTDNISCFTSFDKLSLSNLSGMRWSDRLFRAIYFFRRNLKAPKK